MAATHAPETPPLSNDGAAVRPSIRGTGAAEFLQAFAWLTLIGSVIAGIVVIVHGNQCYNRLGYTCGGLIGMGALIIAVGVMWCAVLYALGLAVEHVIAIRTAIEGTTVPVAATRPTEGP
jgi:hypothetical protein